MIRREFVWAPEGESDSGAQGWRLKALPDFDPVSGFGLAHDVIEHFDQSGTIEEEGRAFGAILWGRHNGGWWQDGFSHYPEFGYQTGNECGEFVARAGYVEPVRVHRLDDEDTEAQIAEMVRRAQRWQGSNTVLTDAFVRDVRSFANWVRIGYRKAERRWGRHMDCYQFCDLFRKIENHPLARYEFEPESELDRLVISVSPKRRTVDFKLISYTDPYL